MSMDKLFDGSDAHLLPGNAELIERLRDGLVSAETSCDAADALEAADKRIAELEAENAAQLTELHAISVALGTAEGHSSVHHIEAMREKLAVAREALKNLFLSSPIALECNDMHHTKKDQHEYNEDCPVLSRYEDALSGAREALAQIGGDDAS